MIDLESWWASLAVVEKERIATNAARKAGNPNVVVRYPDCTRWWNTIPTDKKVSIHNHCTDKHGLLLPEWKEGYTLSY